MAERGSPLSQYRADVGDTTLFLSERNRDPDRAALRRYLRYRGMPETQAPKMTQNHWYLFDEYFSGYSRSFSSTQDYNKVLQAFLPGYPRGCVGAVMMNDRGLGHREIVGIVKCPFLSAVKTPLSGVGNSILVHLQREYLRDGRLVYVDPHAHSKNWKKRLHRAPFVQNYADEPIPDTTDDDEH